MSWENDFNGGSDDDLDSLHSDDNDTTEFFGETGGGSNNKPVINEEPEEEKPVIHFKSETVNRGLRRSESINDSDDQPSKWDKYKM